MELRNKEGEVAQSLNIDPRKIHIHPTQDIALCRISTIPNNFSLKPQKLTTRILLPTEIVFMFGHTATMVPGSIDGIETEDIILSPDMIKGSVTYRYQDKYYLSTPKLPSHGMCGGPTLNEDEVIGMLEGYVKSEGILKDKSCLLSSHMLSEFQSDVEEMVLSEMNEWKKKKKRRNFVYIWKCMSLKEEKSYLFLVPTLTMDDDDDDGFIISE